MKILALDQATNVTAWCIWNDGKPTKFGSLDLHLEKSIYLRSEEMCQFVWYLLKKEMPYLLAIEDVSYQRDASALINLTRLQGRIIQMATELGIPVVFYKPSAWRKEVGIKTGQGIKRPELKEAAINMVYEEYGIRTTEDIAEAICIGKCALMKLKGFKGEK